MSTPKGSRLMSIYIALLRGVNVGGTSKLAMSDLRALCQDAGFRDARTYIASGNVVFSSPLPEPDVKNILENSLNAHMGQSIAVMIRNTAEMTAILTENPFPQAPADRVVAFFLDTPALPSLLDSMTGQAADEQVRLGRREIYVWYGHGQGRSKLRIPAAKAATARNMNTIARLVDLAAETLA